KTLADRIDDELARERMVGALAAAFGAFALLLAAVGLYGVLAFSVARRTKEIGLRMALGSTVRGVLWLVAKEAPQLVAIGVVLGVGASLATGKLVAANFTGVVSADVTAYVFAVIGMVVIALAAVALPAVRASRVDPLRALRSD